MIRKTTKSLALPLLCGALMACQDLEVINQNRPDSERALLEPGAVEQVIRSAFPIWWRIQTNNDIWPYYPVISNEFSRTALLRQFLPGAEPRVAFKNDPLADEVWIPRAPWDAFNSGLANSVDGLHRIINGNLVISTLDPGATIVTDNTNRARIFAKVMEGLNLGYVGLVMDQGPLYTHEDVLPTGYDDLIAWERDNLRPYGELITGAVAVLDSAIADMDRSPDFTIPNTWINLQTLSKQQLREFANSLIARLLVYSARTPAERVAVNWQKVLAATGQGLTFDFGPTLASGVITNTHWARLQGNGSNDNIRPNYSLIGPADTSGAYAIWAAAPLANRERFNIATPDRRITGTTPTSPGAYFRHRADNTGFDATRGLYQFSAYQWYRNNGSSNTGFSPVMTADENRLLRAEAMLRTNNNAEAANLINVSRTRTVRIGTAPFPGLPAVTAQGVPVSAGCVPKGLKTGVGCGTLLEALMYERGIELAGTDPTRGWLDRRGFGQLVPGTILHMPIPARYLIALGLPLYSFGGIGGAGAAQ
ncbi:MAG: hypothetical protein ACREMA_05745 [Longimicrobiales bacterium]